MNKRNGLLIGLLSSFLVISFISVKNNPKEALAAEELSLQSGGDAFKLLDRSYGEDESFVYTADLHFKSGQAGGLAFGSQDGDHYYVINMDRFENHIKLLYFASNGGGGYAPTELRVDYFIGHDKMEQTERDYVNPRVATIENVNLKVILTREEEHAYVEFYVEGIKRFGVDTVIDLNDLGTSFTYQGGYLGMNCFNADVYLENIEIGRSDYSYFSEPYRNQYHLQPFAKWSNDPNALCYFNGWYHVFYQTHPFGLQWGEMYWGHARSRDLIHFEFLPICLFPELESGWGIGTGYAWSGCAIAYTKGMSDSIDFHNWFPNGNGNGLYAVFTRDGGKQDQIIMSSDDEGLTWTKRRRIDQSDLTGYEGKIDWRDPKIFPLVKDNNGKVTVWGMTLSSYALNQGWFLRSFDLLTWGVVGRFAFPTPECIGVGVLTDENNQEHAYLTNKSRTYILGTIEYDSMNGKVIFRDEDNVDISTYTLEEMPLKPLDFGPDSYASQSFYINDPSSEFNGKDIVLNWFSGDLNASFCTGPGEYANLRKRWNGGFTIPVEYGIYQADDEYRISQKPITVGNDNLAKTNIVDIEDQDITSSSENPLSNVHTHVFELDASITTKDDSPITFKVDVGDNEYMQFGWNKVDGYYVDRTYLDDKGINTNIDWHKKYVSHILGDSDVKTFYVLSDNGGLEVFCEDFSISFYFVTTASIYSTGASLKADSAHINKLELNNVHSVYRQNEVADEGVLYVSNTDVNLDDKLSNSKFVSCWYSGSGELAWETIENDDVVDATFTQEGVNLVALKQGSAQFKVSVGNQTEIINVSVFASSFVSDLSFNKENIVSGQWLMKAESIVGEMNSGNGFLLSNETGSDFTFSGKFSILDGTAASLVFRAASDMSSYLVANYDRNERIVKLWSTHGELARSSVMDVSVDNIVLSVKANEKDVQVTINGNLAINYTLKDDEPLSGRFGLNVFSAKAEFKELSIAKENYEYSSGELEIKLPIDQFIVGVYNVTLGNIRLDPGFYYQSNGNLYIKQTYFDLIKENGRYQFKVVGDSYSFNFNVDVNITHQQLVIDDIDIELGNDVNVYIGLTEVSSVIVNGDAIDSSKYSVSNYTLHIKAECFKEGDNVVTINNQITFMVTANSMDDEIVHTVTKIDYAPMITIIVIASVVVVAVAIAVPLIIISVRRKKKCAPQQ